MRAKQPHYLGEIKAMAITRSEEAHVRISAANEGNATEDYDQGHEMGYTDAEAGKAQNVPTWLSKDIQDGYRAGYAEYSFGTNPGEPDLTGLTDGWENSPYYGGCV
jgi:hypothetical protein